MPEDYSIKYRILNFISVFTVLFTFVKCKEYNGNVKFQTASSGGLRFKIVILCDSYLSRNISSCPYVGNTYEINRCFIFTMQVLGLGSRLVTSRSAHVEIVTSEARNMLIYVAYYF